MTGVHWWFIALLREDALSFKTKRMVKKQSKKKKGEQKFSDSN